jgi:hypothetical protein
MVLMERLLQRMQPIRGRSDAFDGEEFMSVRLHREHQAGPRRAAIEEDGAGAAHAMLTTEMGAGQAKLVTHKIGQRHPDLDLLLVPLAVDGQRDFSRLAHPRSSRSADAATPAGSPSNSRP